MEEELQVLVTKLTNGYGETHNEKHAALVCDNALAILDQIEGDEEVRKVAHVVKVREVVLAAAWLHDVLDHKMISNPTEYKEKEEEIRKFLVERFSEKECKLVMDITVNVSFSKEKSGVKKDLGQFEVLRNIVSDADKLEAIGELGVLRCFKYNKEAHPGLSEEETISRVIQHCHDKLLHLAPSYIRTAPGKEMARPLHDAIVKFTRGEITLKELAVKHGVEYF